MSVHLFTFYGPAGSSGRPPGKPYARTSTATPDTDTDDGNEADVAIDPDILAILACPSPDHAPLREERRDDADVLVCSFCATVYPIRDSIPVLLIDDATAGPNGIGHAAETVG